jgi:hypothetical protein
MITLPNGRGRLFIAIYVKGSDAPEALRERAVAEIARSVFDSALRLNAHSRASDLHGSLPRPFHRS